MCVCVRAGVCLSVCCVCACVWAGGGGGEAVCICAVVSVWCVRACVGAWSVGVGGEGGGAVGTSARALLAGYTNIPNDAKAHNKRTVSMLHNTQPKLTDGVVFLLLSGLTCSEHRTRSCSFHPASPTA